jgi:hypothetical protein
MPFTTEASCLCYTGISTYAPSIFDGYWASCLDYYQTASPAFYSSSLQGDTLTRTPCAAAGNVLDTAAATGGVSSIVATSVTEIMSDHSIYLRVSGVYIHEITQGLTPYLCVTWKVPAWSQV